MAKIKSNYFYSFILLLFTATMFFSCSSSDNAIDDDEELIIIPVEPEEEPVDPGSIIVSDEVTTTSIACSNEFENPDRFGPDLPNSVNVGSIDDRSCYSNYSENVIDNTTWGVYNITANSNHLDSKLQPRIERYHSRAGNAVGNYVRFTGTVRILETGKTSSYGQDGTYIMQAKGKHGLDSNGEEIGSPDPAICLYLAKPVMATDSNGNEYQKSFRIYREQIKYRGGEGSGREVVFLTEVQKGEIVDITLEVGFKADPNDSSKKIHYADATIGGESFPFVIPDPERGLQSGIRYGAYRIKGGRAQIRWANTTYVKQ